MKDNMANPVTTKWESTLANTYQTMMTQNDAS